ncbi:MAG: MBL fold metallo-hydrolase [Bacteroidetes bacterium]|nr:MBL fold metallo-hydrolase [Bacteroidota bacterium]
MFIEQIYTSCLAQGAYYIHSGGEALVIDPLRETQPYLERAERDNVKIKYILETHFHADFVSGHIGLAKETGAQIVFGPHANPSFGFYSAQDGEELKLGNLTIKVLHTPGHTMESTCYLLLDEKNKEIAVFTGDTLFIGDVGRPDLAQKATSMTQEELAGLLYDSLRSKLITLPDHVIVYPAHGAGSACGKNMSKETMSTIGEQKTGNYALSADMTKEEFIKELTGGLLPPPRYFGANVEMNKTGYNSINEVINRGVNPLIVDTFELLANQTDAIVLDTRNAEDFALGHIPMSIFIGLDGQFAPWVGTLIKDIEQKILLVTDVGRESEAVKRLARVGYDNVLGYLNGGITSWRNSGKICSTVSRITAGQLEQGEEFRGQPVIDVRKPAEFEAEHLELAMSLPLDFIHENFSSYPKSQSFVLHCAGGYRSMIAASILKSKGCNDLVDVIGGYSALSKTSLPKINLICSIAKK